MNIVVAIDSFKGSLSSLQAGNAVKAAALKADPYSEITVFPIADGGEGTVDALSAGPGGKIITATVMGPLQLPVDAKYCILEDKNTAVIEMASAAGITLIPQERRDPLVTTTFGVGELIKDAISQGCRNFIIGIGGSATNDGGVGMLSALGFEFTDKNGRQIKHGAEGLSTLCSISVKNILPELSECSFRIACDVTNPLCGKNGCSMIFGPQKGADPETIEKMDDWLRNYSMIAASISPKADPDYPGAGAAGGLGFAFMTFLNSTLEPGIKIILEETDIESHIKKADLVITGEGRLDAQTVMGKAPVGVAHISKKYGKRVIAFSGCVTDTADICNEYGIDAFFSITPGAISLEDAMNTENAYRNLSNTAYQVFRLLYK